MKKLIVSALLYLASWGLSSHVSAQSPSVPSRADVINDAQAFFAAGRYTEARNALLGVVAENEKDARLCYLLGASSALCGQDPDGAVRMLRFAQLRNYQKNQANLYVGRAYQLSCEFEQAQQSFEKFLKTNTVDSLARQAEKWMAECESSVALAAKIFCVKTLSKVTLPQGAFLSAYHPSADVGTVCHNSDFFQSDIAPDGIMYRTERGDAVFFALPDDDGHCRLQKVEQLIGGWSDMSPLRGTEPADGDDGEDIMPFLMTDGVTLYFSSNRAGGMGGYDLYRTTYDSETRSFTEPQNMGVPFNSAADDYLFVADEGKRKAWFASNRACGTDSLAVYEIVWDDSVIRNFAKSTQEIRDALAMTSEGTAEASVASVHMSEDIRLRDQFRLVICDSLTYTQWEHFRSSNAETLYRQAISVGAQKDSLTHLMARQRKEFAALGGSAERNAKLQELLATERRIYSLEDEMADRIESARNAEILAVQRLISEGRYIPLSKIRIRQKSRAIDWAQFLRPSNFEAYSASAFAEEVTDEDILDVLDPKDAAEMVRQDSLLGWTTIIKLEADIIMDRARSGATPECIGPDGVRVKMSLQDAQQRVADYRQAAALLAARAHDSKRAILRAKLEKMKRSIKPEFDLAEVVELQAKGDNYFSMVEDVDLTQAKPPTASNVINMKARGVKTYAKAVLRIVAHQDGTFQLPLHKPAAPVMGGASSVATATDDKPVSSPAPESNTNPSVEPISGKTPAEQAPVKETPAKAAPVKPAPVEPEPSASKTSPAKPAFRIQLGAFRNRPAALAQLPNPAAVSSEPINDNRGLTRYFYGTFASEAEAAASMDAARKAGFAATLVKM